MSTAVCFSSFPPVKASSGECPRESARCPVSGEYPVYTPGLRFFQKKIAGHAVPQAFSSFDFAVVLPVFFHRQIKFVLPL